MDLTRTPVITANVILGLAAILGCGGETRTGGGEGSSVTADTASHQLLTAVAATAGSVDGLDAVIDVASQTVQGRYRRLRFDARLTEEGRGIASFERIAGMTLVSTIDGPRQGSLEWRGTTLDGFGALSNDESEALAHLADRLKVDELARIPLDLTCQAGADELAPAIGAALLLPWQILLKYQPEGEIPTPEETGAESQCQHLARPTEARDPDRAPSPSIITLSTEQPFPMAVGYLPLDREGFAALGRAEEGEDDQR